MSANLTLHDYMPLGHRHPVHNYEYEDETEMNAASGFIAEDVGKWALLDDGSFWRLTATTPTWEKVGAADITAAISSAIAAEVTARNSAIATAVSTSESARDAADGNLAVQITKTLFGRRLSKSGAYTLVAADKGSLVDCTGGPWTLSLTAAATLGDNFAFGVYNRDAGVITIDPNGSETIEDYDGSATTKTLAQGEGCIVICDGTGFVMFKIAAPGAGGGGTAAGTSYDNTTSGLSATDVQAAIDEIVSSLSGLSGAAADITYDNSTSGLSATDVQGAIDELAATSGGGSADARDVWLLG